MKFPSPTPLYNLSRNIEIQLKFMWIKAKLMHTLICEAGLKIHDLSTLNEHEYNALVLTIPQAGHAAALFTLRYCASVRPEDKNITTMNWDTQNSRNSLWKSAQERERAWRRVAGFCPGACLVGESASLSRTVCGGPEDDSLWTHRYNWPNKN